MLKNPSKKFLDPHPEADDFQNVTSISLSTDTHVVKFSWRSIQQILRKVDNRQTDRQTDKREALHNVLGGRNNTCFAQHHNHSYIASYAKLQWALQPAGFEFNGTNTDSRPCTPWHCHISRNSFNRDKSPVLLLSSVGRRDKAAETRDNSHSVSVNTSSIQ